MKSVQDQCKRFVDDLCDIWEKFPILHPDFSTPAVSEKHAICQLNINLADHCRVSLRVFALANSGRGHILVLIFCCKMAEAKSPRILRESQNWTQVLGWNNEFIYKLSLAKKKYTVLFSIGTQTHTYTSIFVYMYTCPVRFSLV